MAFNQLDSAERGGGSPTSQAFTDPRMAFSLLNRQRASAAGGGGGGGLIPSWQTTSQPAAIASQGASTAGGGSGILGALGGGSGLLDTLGRIGGIASGAASGSADRREAESAAELRRYIAALSGAQFDSQQQDRARRAQVLMQLLNNTQDASITPGNPAIASRMPTMTGGARPSNLTTNRDTLMAALAAPGPSAPAVPGVSRPGAGENALGATGTILEILGALRRQPSVEPRR